MSQDLQEHHVRSTFQAAFAFSSFCNACVLSQQHEHDVVKVPQEHREEHRAGVSSV